MLLTGSIFQSVRSQLPLSQGLGPDLWLAQACAVTHCGCVFRVNSLVLTGSTYPVSNHTHNIICERKLSLYVSALILAATPAGIVQRHSLTEVRAPSVKIAGVQQITDNGPYSQSTEGVCGCGKRWPGQESGQLSQGARFTRLVTETKI